MFSINEHNEEREWQKLRESEREYGIELGLFRADLELNNEKYINGL